MSQKSSAWSKKREGSADKSKQDRELEKLRARQQKYLNAFEDLALLRDHYKLELKKRLEQKVKEQRARFEQRKKNDEKKNLENLKAKESAQKKKILPDLIPAGESDFSFLDGLPVSNVYRITKIERILQKQGHLKYKSDRDDLWSLLSAVENLAIIEKHITEEDPSLNVKDLKQLVQEPQQSQDLPALCLEKDGECVEADNRVGKGKVTFQSNAKSDPHRDKIEIPKTQPPKFRVVFSNISTETRDFEEERRFEELRVKREKRLKKQAQVKEMYSHSTTYKAATERLMRKHSLGAYDTNFSIPEIRHAHSLEEQPRLSPQPSSKISRSMRSPELDKPKPQRDQFRWILTDDVEKRVVTKQPRSEVGSSKSGRRTGHSLSLQAAEQGSTVRVAKSMSQLWTNPKK